MSKNKGRAMDIVTNTFCAVSPSLSVYDIF